MITYDEAMLLKDDDLEPVMGGADKVPLPAQRPGSLRVLSDLDAF